MWDATCVDTFCGFRIHALLREAGGAAAIADKDKLRKYAHLDRSYVFHPTSVETCGSVGPDRMCFLHNLGHGLKSATGEPQSFTNLR